MLRRSLLAALAAATLAAVPAIAVAAPHTGDWNGEGGVSFQVRHGHHGGLHVEGARYEGARYDAITGFDHAAVREDVFKTCARRYIDSTRFEVYCIVGTFDMNDKASGRVDVFHAPHGRAELHPYAYFRWTAAPS
jgi:hypothetical protein